MAGTNDFLPFATAGGANVLSQASYAALAAVATGYQSGVAQSPQLNKTWRQASIIASMVAQFIVDQTGANAVDDGTIATLEANFVAALRFAGVAIGTDTGLANACVVNFTPAIPSLVDGMVLWFQAAAANTGAATINVNGLGAKPLVGAAQTPLQGGEIVVGGKCMVVWSAGLASFILIEGTGAALQVAPPTKSGHAVQVAQVQGNTLVYGVDSGTANTCAVAFAPAVATLTDGMVFWFKAAAANTGATTLNANGLGAKPVVGAAHTALQGGEIVANGRCLVLWNATLNSFVLIECTGAALQVGPATQSSHAMQLGQAVGRLLRVTVFTSSATWTKGAGTNLVVSEIYGAGGGAGGTAATGAGQIAASGGGGGGGYSLRLISSPGATEVVTIGAAGTGTSGNGVGGAGGTTSFGAWHSATGGGGGQGCPTAAQANVPGGAGGIGVSGNVNLSGSAGGASYGATATSALGGISGYGGSVAKGSGGVAGVVGTSPGAAGATGGGGGSGAFGYNGAGVQGGGSGGPGYAVIFEYS